MNAVRRRVRPPRWAVVVLGVEGCLLIVLAVAGLVHAGFAFPTATPPTYLLGLRMNALHGCILLVTGVAAIAALVTRRATKRFVLAQAVVYLMLFVYGVATSAGSPKTTLLNLNTADNVLHGALWLFAFVLTMMLSTLFGRAQPRDPADQAHPD